MGDRAGRPAAPSRIHGDPRRAGPGPQPARRCRRGAVIHPAAPAARRGPSRRRSLARNSSVSQQAQGAALLDRKGGHRCGRPRRHTRPQKARSRGRPSPLVRVAQKRGLSGRPKYLGPCDLGRKLERIPRRKPCRNEDALVRNCCGAAASWRSSPGSPGPASLRTDGLQPLPFLRIRIIFSCVHVAHGVREASGSVAQIACARRRASSRSGRRWESFDASQQEASEPVAARAARRRCPGSKDCWPGTREAGNLPARLAPSRSS